MKKLMIALFMMSLLYISSCVPVPYLLIFNNSKYDLKIEILGNKTKQVLNIKSKNKLKILGPSYSNKIKISSKSHEWNYMYNGKKPFPKEFLNYGFNSTYIYFQIEPDGKIYILKKENFPVKLFPKQPEGYPLIPLNEIRL